MIYSAYKLNMQGDNIQPYHTPFSISNQWVVPCLILAVAFWSIYRFLRRQVKCSGIPISSRVFQFVVIHRVKGSGIVSEEEVDDFLELPWFLHVTNLISGSSVSLKASLYIWKVSVHILLKSSLYDFEYNLASLWNEHSCTTVWTLFTLPYFGIGIKMELF